MAIHAYSEDDEDIALIDPGPERRSAAERASSLDQTSQGAPEPRKRRETGAAPRVSGTDIESSDADEATEENAWEIEKVEKNGDENLAAKVGKAAARSLHDAGVRLEQGIYMKKRGELNKAFQRRLNSSLSLSLCAWAHSHKQYRRGA